MRKKIQRITSHHHFFPSLAIFFGLVAIGISISAQVSVWADNNVGGEANNPNLQNEINNKPISCSYKYGSWGECDSSGKQIREIKSKSPSGCVEDYEPEVTQDCSYVAKTSCSYSYSSWSECDPLGKQTRKVTSKIPSGCIEDFDPVTTQSCTYVAPQADSQITTKIACSYKYGSWSECDPSGKQTREIKSKSPSGCEETTAPDLSRSCAYVAPQNNDNTDNNSNANKNINTDANNNPNNNARIVACSYTYGVWSACNSSGKQIRAITSKSPSGCIENITPVLEQSCTYNIFSSINVTETGIEKNKDRVSVDVNPSISPINHNNRQNESTDKNENPSVNEQAMDPNSDTSADWQRFYFGSVTCLDANICSKASDPDNDGIINEDEYRFGTNPVNSDTDQDGFIDGEEVKAGFNPSLKALTGERNDKIIFENPKEKGEIKSEIYKIEKVEMVRDDKGGKKIKFSGKALPNSFVTIYIYSDPIILTVKTDNEGNWSYELDNEMENGEHEVYVAVTDNTGKITEKSQSFAFIKTAEAISVIPPIEASAQERAISPTQAWSRNDSLFFIAIGLGGLALALAAIGIFKYNFQKKSE